MCEILWIDNDAENLEPYAEYLKKFDLDITLEASPDRAFEMLSSDRQRYQCLLLDIKFYKASQYPDDESKIFNGFDFLNRMIAADMDIPVCVLSSYLHLKENEERLTDYTEARNLRGMVLDKFLADIDSDIFKLSFVDKLVEFIKKVENDRLSNGIEMYSSKRASRAGPFKISYNEFQSMNKAQRAKLRRDARDLVSDQLAELNTSVGAIWALYIGGKQAPYRTVTSVKDIPSTEEIRALAFERDRVPFQFRIGTQIEDRWGSCGSAIEQASYAKIGLSTRGLFGSAEWRVHFDTGSYESFFSLEEFLELGLFTDPALMTDDVHRGTDFSYRKENVKFRLKDRLTDETIDVVAHVNLVEGWSGAPFLAPCAKNCKSGQRLFLGSVRNCVNRPGLIGRSFLIEGGLVVQYDPQNPILSVSTAE
jgi:CheY-like chemotaxis protein